MAEMKRSFVNILIVTNIVLNKGEVIRKEAISILHLRCCRYPENLNRKLKGEDCLRNFPAFKSKNQLNDFQFTLLENLQRADLLAKPVQI